MFSHVLSLLTGRSTAVHATLARVVRTGEKGVWLILRRGAHARAPSANNLRTPSHAAWRTQTPCTRHIPLQCMATHARACWYMGPCSKPFWCTYSIPGRSGSEIYTNIQSVTCIFEFPCTAREFLYMVKKDHVTSAQPRPRTPCKMCYGTIQKYSTAVHVQVNIAYRELERGARSA